MRYIYITTNSVNGKRYLGQRKVPKGKTPESDNYLGSGTLLLKAIKKYGKSCFSKEIIHKCYTQADADTLEIQEIEQRHVLENRDQWYNRDAGGQYGRSEKHSAIASVYMKEFYSKEENQNKLIEAQNKSRIANGIKPYPYNNVQERRNYKENVLPLIKRLKKGNKKYRNSVIRAYRAYSKGTIPNQYISKEEKKERRSRGAHASWANYEYKKENLQQAMDKRVKEWKETGKEFFSTTTRRGFMMAKYRQHHNYIGLYIVTNHSVSLKPIEHVIRSVNADVYKSNDNYSKAINNIIEYLMRNGITNVTCEDVHEMAEKRRRELNIALNEYKK